VGLRKRSPLGTNLFLSRNQKAGKVGKVVTGIGAGISFENIAEKTSKKPTFLFNSLTVPLTATTLSHTPTHYALHFFSLSSLK